MSVVPGQLHRSWSVLEMESVGLCFGENTRSWGGSESESESESEGCIAGNTHRGRRWEIGSLKSSEVSIATTACDEDETNEVEDILLPSREKVEGKQAMGISTIQPPQAVLCSKDDSSIKMKPAVHIDYLSHDWTDVDLLATWKYVNSNQASYEDSPRLKNASWRSWRKTTFKLETLPCASLGWYEFILRTRRSVMLTSLPGRRTTT